MGRPPRADEVASSLERRIVAERWPPGHFIGTLPDLAREAEVSLPTLRRALHQLEADGVVEIRTGQFGGAYVATPEAQPLIRGLSRVVVRDRITTDQLHEFRRLLEAEAARLAAERVTPDELRALADSVDRMRVCIPRDPEGFLDENLTFHHGIAEAARNPILLRVYQSFERQVRRSIAYDYGEAVQEAVVHAHERILEALRKRDGDAAYRRMARHLRAFDDFRAFAQPDLFQLPRHR